MWSFSKKELGFQAPGQVTRPEQGVFGEAIEGGLRPQDEAISGGDPDNHRVPLNDRP